MEKEFVPYVLSKQIKQLGFNEECFGYYVDVEVANPFLVINRISDTQGGYFTLAPLWQQAFRWFREKYGIIGNVNDNCILENTYSISISKIFDSRILYVNGRNHNLKDKQGFTTYEEAELECLKKLIEIVKK